MSAADVHSILYRGEDPLKKKFVPKNEQKTHVPRHWPGKLRAAVLERRRREERLLQQQQQQQQEESEESEESEFSDVSEDQPEETNVVLHKPAFVPKASRLTVMEREEQQRRVREEQQQQQQQVEQRKLETKQMVYAVLAREDEEAADAPVIPVEAQQQQQQQQQQQKNLMGSEEMPDDTDGLDAAQEYEDWKLRELERIRRDKEEQLEREKFLEAVERRRQMTAEERREDDKELDKMQPKREIRHKYNFMQKYYHRGAFFQDLARSGEEPLYLRDFNAPVGEDKVDKKTLPKILQLRRGELARGGRSKHTHLVDVDTSDLSHPWAQATRDLQGQKLLKKAAGIKGANDFERPSLRKPKQDS
ncbi:Microfibrillar-associated protein 1, putative [Eimeria tenella]|uniref:Microfibrillar-associated protein 1, putative n=1 Tax=Eimeria tenella TaxID=5802 RepID=U6KWJ5_EIMTE|nr:Microfibrillar-associated protein 1, putative [Eimeria tenella]CDJ41298.1 Microfibrillar-associated protein 1, putative [Eimeria tenella]|eukprot:XP_013232048.1 Microfibrillar-associated protein 1, putative [Eimeria tenella]